MGAKEQFPILCAFPALRAYPIRRGGFFFFILAKAQSRKEIVVHSYPQMGQLPPDPPRRTGTGS
jgi:hypothetical protein